MTLLDTRAWIRTGASAAIGCLLLLSGASPALASPAPGAPGQASVWADAGKTGVGAAYEAYVNGQYADGGRTGAVSRVWFSIADGVLTETMYGLIHEAQLKQAQFAVQTPTGLVLETTGMVSRTAYLHTDAQGRPLSPAYRIINRDKAGRFEIEKRIFTDPDRNAVFMRVTFRPLKGPMTPYLLVEPHVANAGSGNAGAVDAHGLYADREGSFLAVKATQRFTAASAGFLGVSDGLIDLAAHGRLTALHPDTGTARGAVMLAAALPKVSGRPVTVDVTIGFGHSRAEASAAASGALRTGYREVLARYNGEGARVGWEDYVRSLTELPRIARMAEDGGRLAYASALVLKVHEDRTHAGALIASLSNPWGEGVSAAEPSTGYKAVWPRDFYQCAMALAALGDRETPVAAFRYLQTIQVASRPGAAGGWFQQKSRVDGQPEWTAVQLDQTAMPIMLGWKLWKLGLIGPDELKQRYGAMLRPAADFLVEGGQVDFAGNRALIRPPYTQQERWEEQAGYSPSTTAAVITGLVAAADIADLAADPGAARRYRAAADRDAAAIGPRMLTTNGAFADGRYFLRIAPTESPNDHAPIPSRNGQPERAADTMLDAGLLELVRYGVLRPDDSDIVRSLAVIDDQTRGDDLRVRYDFGAAGKAWPGFRRYGGDGYGEDAATGGGYGSGGRMSATQRGRVWPLLTGERGQYALALAARDGPPGLAAIKAIRDTYVRGLERFANQGLMLPEQVWDGVGAPLAHRPAMGQGTGSATPLAWAHAEYVKLLRSLADRAVWDANASVQARYGVPGR